MTITANNTVKQSLKALGDAITALLGGTVILGIENRVAMPTGNFIVMTPLRDERQSTNVTEYPERTGTLTHELNRDDTVYSELTIQLDCYGTNAREQSAALMMLSRSDLMISYGITPLFASDPHNLPFVDSEQQNRERWTLDLTAQFNTTWTQPIYSATELETGVYNADANFTI